MFSSSAVLTTMSESNCLVSRASRLGRLLLPTTGDVDGRRLRLRLRFVVLPKPDPRVGDMVPAAFSRSRLELPAGTPWLLEHDACNHFGFVETFRIVPCL